MLTKRLLSAVLMSLAWCTEASYFTPFIVDSSNDQVCNIVLDHYVELFKGDTNDTSGPIKSSLVYNPEFTEQELDEHWGTLKYSKVTIEGVDKVFAYHRRWYGWRGEIYTGYVINPDELVSLSNDLISVNHKRGEEQIFYPYPDLTGRVGFRRVRFSWHENLPFRVGKNWYVRHDQGGFVPGDGVIKVAEISASGETKSVCQIKMFEEQSPNKPDNEFPFLSAYQRATEEMLVSLGARGSSNPEVRSLARGRLHVSSAVIRPWAVKPYWSEYHNVADSEYISNLKRHFENWKYQDAWSYREREVFENASIDAQTELKKHYVDNFSYSEKKADKLASSVIENMPGRYYSLGVFNDKDFSPFKQILEGRYQRWGKVKDDLAVKYQPPTLAALSLSVDIPDQLNNLPEGIAVEDIKTNYGKDLLMFAVHMNNYDVAKSLIDDGWPIERVIQRYSGYDQFYSGELRRAGRSALTYAVENGSIEMIQLLVSAGADKQIKDSKGNTLDYYIQKNPRFSSAEKALGLDGLLERYDNAKKVKPSFDCSSPQLNRIEQAVCASTGLAIYDRELSNLYKRVGQHAELAAQIKQSQIEWIKYRHKICSGYDTQDQLNGCIARTTRARVRYLRYVLDAVSFTEGDPPLPVKPRR